VFSDTGLQISQSRDQARNVSMLKSDNALLVVRMFVTYITFFALTLSG
jgi:hypothetical protein